MPLLLQYQCSFVSACRHFVAVALERTMRLSFREFHMQFDPTLRRERVPEAMFQLVGPPPSAKPVFEGKPVPAPAKGEQQEMTDAEQSADAPAAPQPNGTAAAVASEEAATAAAAPAAAAPAGADDTDELEPVPEIARQLFAQVLLRHPCNCTPCRDGSATACFVRCQVHVLKQPQLIIISLS